MPCAQLFNFNEKINFDEIHALISAFSSLKAFFTCIYSIFKIFEPHRGAAWEEAFLEVVGKAEDGGRFKHISTARFASRTLELELEANTKTVVPYFTSTFIIMGLFSVVTSMMTDWVRSKPWLGLLGNISAAMATVAAFGLCIYLGVDFIGLNLAAPFLMIGKLLLKLSSIIGLSEHATCKFIFRIIQLSDIQLE